VFVCLCHALTDRDICRAAEACSRVAEVYRCYGCTPECGQCVPYVRAAMRARDTGLGAPARACDPEACGGESQDLGEAGVSEREELR